jgi:head-tail adaptor
MRNTTANISQSIPSIAALRERVTVQTFTTTRGDNGEQVNTWADLRSDWAMVEYPVTGNDERYFGDQEMSLTRARITMRYQGDIQPKMRIVHDIDGSRSMTYDVLYSAILGARKFEVFTCESVE